MKQIVYQLPLLKRNSLSGKQPQNREPEHNVYPTIRQDLTHSRVNFKENPNYRNVLEGTL